MKKFTMFACLALTLAFALNAFAEDYPQRALGHDSVFHGGSTSFAKDVCDTVFLIGPWGSDAQANGQFEASFDGQNSNGIPAWNDWTSVDLTAGSADSHWHVSSYEGGVNGSLAAYCGDETLEACSDEDPVGGYGNGWVDVLQYSYAVADPSAPCTVTVTGVASSNTEPGYDYVYFRFETADGLQDGTEPWDGVHDAEAFTASFDYNPSQYVGENADEIRFQFDFRSDSGYSDQDCLYTSDGGVRIDDVNITISNGGLDYTENFDDGELGDWNIVTPPSVGDFAQLWQNLADKDPCFSNYSAQVGFINTGEQVPGVDGSPCVNWCYGPGGYIVNTTGGASLDPNAYLHNAVESPVLDWPADPAYIGCAFTFGVYRHEDLTPDSPGMFYTWSVRSATADEDINEADWRNRNFVYYGGPDYVRAGDDVSDLLVPGRTKVQVQLAAFELGWQFGYIGDDGTPAPYFDNVRLKAYCQEGPAMSTRAIDLAQDNWPEIQILDMTNLASNSVRFDMANNNGTPNQTHNTPGDSIVVQIASVRPGGELVSNRLVYSMQRNPVFDSVRDPNWGATGSVDGVPVVGGNGQVIADKFAYDLPDTGFLFPGDVLHYYIEATDEAGGVAQTATLPADIEGFGDFSHPLAYNRNYTVRALPTVDAAGVTPKILFWNDFASRGGEDEWLSSLDNIGLELGVHYDMYYTNGPSSGVGNGLGGRASVELLSNYNHLLYTSGDLGAMTLGDGRNDPGDDVSLISNWLFNYEVNAFFTGDNLVSDLSANNHSNFLDTYMNVVFSTANILTSIGNQTSPLVLPVAGNSVFFVTPAWIAYGGCPGINNFDGVQAGEGAERLARFTNDSGVPSYDYSAATLNVMDNGNKVITMPYDLMFIHTDPENIPGSGLSARASVLKEVLSYFGLDDPSWQPTPVPGVEQFYAKNYPNPFNPTTKIEFNMPKAGHLTLKIYNVRGELVKTLIDEQRAAGADHIMWDGTNDLGSPVSSGVYFYEARAAGEVSVNKMALVK
ncbi:hypothetical protein CSB20_02095 [bacterium DOLZORAL124_64_63]|nr:MAG: hypothetical protein CSB20_02095 [bacterium DOLZORAL124_64_63]